MASFGGLKGTPRLGIVIVPEIEIKKSDVTRSPLVFGRTPLAGFFGVGQVGRNEGSFLCSGILNSVRGRGMTERCSGGSSIPIHLPTYP